MSRSNILRSLKFRLVGGPKGRLAGGPKGRVAGGPKGRLAGGPKGRLAGVPKGRVAGGSNRIRAIRPDPVSLNMNFSFNNY